MSIEALFTADTDDLPKTIRGQMPYWVEALSPREVWGHGHATTTVVVGQTWAKSALFLRYMLGEWEVTRRTAPGGKQIPAFRRLIPEKLRYPEGAELGTDTRVQWCTGLQQVEQGGNPPDEEGDYTPSDATAIFNDGVTGWPATAYCKYNAVFETTPYVIRTDVEVSNILAQSTGGIPLDDPEFLRYLVRSKRVYNKEQPVPAATNAGGFKIIAAAAADRKSIGQTQFRVIPFGDVSYRWVGVPIGWPPPPGWVVPAGDGPIWPPTFSPAITTFPVKHVRDSYIGTVNSRLFDSFDPEGYSFDEETLLYVGYEEEVYYNASGQRTSNFTFKFKYNSIGWNNVIDASGNVRQVSADVVRGDDFAGTAAGRRLYEKREFQNLFKYVETP